MPHSKDPRHAIHACAAQILLEDETHRTANEIGSALAAMHLAVRGTVGDPFPMLEQAIERLEGFVQVRQILGHPEASGSDMVRLLRDLSTAITKGRDTPITVNLRSNVNSVTVVPMLAQAALRVAHEMLTNAVKHGGGAEAIVVDLKVSPNLLQIRCTNKEEHTRIGGRHLSGGSGVRLMRLLCAENRGRLTMCRREGRFVIQAAFRRRPKPDI